MSPTSGPSAGGTTVTLTGTKFTGASAVKFGATAATSFTVNSATKITATAPAGDGHGRRDRHDRRAGRARSVAADHYGYIAAAGTHGHRREPDLGTRPRAGPP